MNGESFYDQTFSNEGIAPLLRSENRFEACHFKGLDLKDIPISRIKFSDCVFEDCNLERCYMVNTAFQDVVFKNCRILGMEFGHCSPMLLSLRFEKSKLSICSFNGLDLRDCSFSDSELHEIDFESSDCQNISFNGCDLSRSLFESSDLRKVDFREAHGFSIDPERNRLEGALFSRMNIDGLLSKYEITLD